MTTRREEFIEGMSYTLENMKVEWCKLVTPDEFEGKKKWCLNIMLTDKLAEDMSEAGMNVKFTKEDTPRPFVVAYRYTETKKGKAIPMPRCFDEAGLEMDGATIGNGSVCDINVNSQYCTVAGKEHCPLRLDSVVVKELVVYNKEGGESPFGS